MTHMISIVDLVAISVDTLRIGSKYSLEKEFTELTFMNPFVVLYLIFNQVDSYHICVCGCLT